jgi:glutamyl-tRNA synthetase
MFTDSYAIDEEYKAKHWTSESPDIIEKILPFISSIQDFTHTSINTMMSDFTKEHSIQSKLIIHPIRLILTGKPVGAGLYDTMEVLGKQKCVQRIQDFLNNQKVV